MVDVLELLRSRQGNVSDEEFANRFGLRGATLWRYKNRQSRIDTSAREKMINYFAALGDAEMVGALLAYKTGVCFNDEQLATFGNSFLKLRNQATVPA